MVSQTESRNMVDWYGKLLFSHLKILILKFKAIHGLAPKYIDIMELTNIMPRS